MPKRKIKITCSSINGVELSESQTFIVEVNECKEVYKALSTSPDISEWDFVVEEQEEVECLPKETLGPIPQRTKEPSTIKDVVKDELGVTNILYLAFLLDSIHKVGMRSPNLIFDMGLFRKAVKTEYLKQKDKTETPSVELTLTKLILESYFNGTEFDDALEEVLMKMKDVWKEIKNYPTLSSLIQKLFRK